MRSSVPLLGLPPPGSARVPCRSGRGMLPIDVGASFVTLLIMVLLVVVGCGSGPPTGATADQGPAVRQVGVSEFADAVAAADVFVINVHTPDEGSIAGTDVWIPFDQLSQRATELPGDRSTPIALYCMTGRMSAVAAGTLTSMGYSNLIELSGGMKAWTAAGRALQPPGS
ncbi:rhodanese-like domain-containing protein [Rhodococcus sp. WAY2]|uniref:rhodanese-like domain-containing protein n=2 Tax=Rhodococcus TaxID=1827 RepID=UPI002E2DA77A|nr:rhodanese-like domain-containing protein [Rhodococcus sp. WAY2]